MFTRAGGHKPDCVVTDVRMGGLLPIEAAALAGGVGGLFGSILAKWVGDHHAQHLQEQLDHGGLLLWVRTRSAEHEQRASRILSKHSGQDVHVHTLTVPR